MNELLFFTFVIGKLFCSLAAIGVTALAAVKLARREFDASVASALLAFVLAFLAA